MIFLTATKERLSTARLHQVADKHVDPPRNGILFGQVAFHSQSSRTMETRALQEQPAAAVKEMHDGVAVAEPQRGCLACPVWVIACRIM